MADIELIESLRNQLSDPAELDGNSFQVLKGLTTVANAGDSPDDLHELVLRALEHRSEFGEATIVLDALVREVGLFPYIDVDNLRGKDLIAYEVHRPDNMGEDFVFHRPQAAVYRALMAGESVALSAPMSFGKSIIIDALIASGRYENIVVVVPTIALIDETRRRLTERFGSEFKVITQPGQSRIDRNIFILTQERVLEIQDLGPIDLFVIDEFYKLNPTGQDDGRTHLLNHAFYRLNKVARQFYMLGPSVVGLTQQTGDRISCRFINEPYNTVISELHRVDPIPNDMAALMELCRTLNEPTIIYCRSPRRASEVARALITANVAGEAPSMNDAAEWIAEHYHPEWYFGRALMMGIGVHHGRIPRSLGQFVVREFNEDRLKFLVCTSTLIEGVNTKARNIVIFDRTVGRENFDRFTFNNIRGRAGRMGQHFIGHVYLFHDPPEDDLPLLDIPAVSQSEGTPSSLLIQFDEDDLEPRSKEQLEQYLTQSLLSVSTIRDNVGIDLDAQLGLAQRLVDESNRLNGPLFWSSLPTYEQLTVVCELIWNHFDGPRIAQGSVRTASQLTFLISRLRERQPVSQLILEQMSFLNISADDAAEGVLVFLRLWASFHFPRLLRVLGKIQLDVFTRLGLPTGQYDQFATLIENQFFDPALMALDEYGLPNEIAKKLERLLVPNTGLDSALERIKNLDIDRLDLSRFEKRILTDTIAGI